MGTLYEGYFEQWKMYLEQKIRMVQMRKGEHIDLFMSRLQDIHDQLATVGSTPSPTTMVRLALNVVIDDWQVFFQIILGRATLPGWVEMWVSLQ